MNGDNWILHHGDSREVLAGMPDNSIDAIVTDPPYELGFMGKAWDSTGIAYSVDLWREALRVLKPGGHLLAFGGARTYHRLACAVEDAGFEIRDQIMWVYGSGFPKSHNVSIAIDKAAGAMGHRGVRFDNSGLRRQGEDVPNPTGMDAHKPITPEAQAWEGWGTALKPAHEPIVMARKPLVGTVAKNVLEWGTGAINIDGTRVGRADDDVSVAGSRTATFGTQDTVSGGDGSGGWSQNDAGRWPANFIHDGSDEVTDLFPYTHGAGTRTNRADRSPFSTGIGHVQESAVYDNGGSAARFFYCAKPGKKERNAGLDGLNTKQSVGGGGGIGNYLDDVNSASGKYGSEKAPAKNHHPTVKPLDLMRYLVRLVTPVGGTVLDPFAGSGTTLASAILEGFNTIGIELTAEYLPIIKGRIAWAENQKAQTLL